MDAMDIKQMFSSSVLIRTMIVPQLSSPTPSHASRLVLDLLSTTEKARPPGSDETSLLTLCSVS